jgi:hypothetical protein
MISSRLLLSLVGFREYALESNARKRLLIVGDEDEANRVLSLLKMSETSHNFIGYIPLSSTSDSQISTLRPFLLGTIDKFKEIVDVYGIDEIIFCARDIASNSIINCMSMISGKEVEYKIAPPESMFIIGSSSVNSVGELYVIDLNSISDRKNKRNKRLFDVLTSVVLLIISPIIIWFQKKPFALYKNIFLILSGKYSWVSYYLINTISHHQLPRIKKGILSPLNALRDPNLDEATVSRLNSLYAKDYHIYTDLNILRKGWRDLGC